MSKAKAEHSTSLSRLSTPELTTLYDAHQAAAAGYNAIFNEPRCRAYPDVGSLLSDIWDKLLKQTDAVAAELLTRAPDDHQEERARVLIEHELRCGTSLRKVAHLAAGLALAEPPAPREVTP